MKETKLETPILSFKSFSGKNPRKEALQKNKDGSLDLYFGPKSPDGKESNWVQTNSGESFFLYLRLYGPLKPFIEQTWTMNKIERIKEILE